MTNLIAKHGGYKTLKSFQTSVIIYDLTVEFCRRYVQSHKMRDQLEGAARSGSQNIGEGSQTSGTSKLSELRLVDVARASLDELKLDMEAFLRQNNLEIWKKDDARPLEIRQLGYRTDRTYKTYMTYMSEPESAANCLLCLINQANFLLDQQLKVLGKDILEKGDIKERLIEQKKKQIAGVDHDFDEFLKQQGLKRLENGKVVKLEDNEK
jgi:four helix bundle suffix protein